MGLFDFLKSSNKRKALDKRFNQNTADRILYSALSQYHVGDRNIVQNPEVYQQAAKYTLSQKISRCNNDSEYIESLRRNIHYYVNTAHRYNILLRDLLINNMSANDCMRAVDKIQEKARMETKQFILDGNDADAVVANIEIMKASDMPLGNNTSVVRKIDKLENIYQKLSVENDTLISTFAILTSSNRNENVFSNRLQDIDTIFFFDYYFMRLKGFIEACASDFPSVLDRIDNREGMNNFTDKKNAVKFCRECGAPVTEGNRFCVVCGAPV